MDNLQYKKVWGQIQPDTLGFKPYYKWIIFNIVWLLIEWLRYILHSFKPYYKWIIFNITKEYMEQEKNVI